MFKKVLSVFMAALFLLSACTMLSFAKVSTDVDRHLQYGENGQFRIMQVADLQDGFPMRLPTKKLIRRAMETQKPDLVVLTGDNICSGSATKGLARLAINEFMSIFEQYNVPVAMVFGNHDDEDTPANKAYQLSVYEKYNCFIGCAGEDFGPGFLGTYYVPIYSSTDKDEMVSNVWMVDSGTYNTENDKGGYACVTKAQIEWYTNTSKALEAQYGHPIPSVMFQHIIVPEIWDMLVKNEDGAWVLPEGTKGQLGELPCPPAYSNGQLAAVNARGDVMAMFFGHDHVNSYELVRRGCDIINTPGAGFQSYNSEEVGVRMIILDEKNPNTYKTELVKYIGDLFSEEDDVAMGLYLIHSRTSTTKDVVIGILRLIRGTFASLFSFAK